MAETVILPEMVEAGEETLVECRNAKATDRNTALMVYLSMQAIYEIALMRGTNQTRH